MGQVIRVVFFDVHDTLIYINHTPPEIFAALCREAGVRVYQPLLQKIYPGPKELEGRREAFGNDDLFWTNFNAHLLQELNIPDSDQRLVKHIVEGFKENRWWSAYPDAEPTLQELKSQGYQLGIIANARYLITGRLNHTGLTRLFDTITYSEEVGVSKPHQKIFQTALQRSGCTAPEAMHIGDRLLEDIDGARGAGIKPILLDRSDRYQFVDCVKIRSLSEVPLLLSSDH